METTLGLLFTVMQGNHDHGIYTSEEIFRFDEINCDYHNHNCLNKNDLIFINDLYERI